MIMDVVRTNSSEVKAKYADPRRTLIVPQESELLMEDLIAREICVVPISASGYIKRVPADSYEAQNRGGKGARHEDERGRPCRNAADLLHA